MGSNARTEARSSVDPFTLEIVKDKLLAAADEMVYQEGLLFPCVRLCREGEENLVVRDVLRANVRLPRLALGDLDAGLAACRIGARRVEEVCTRYGADIFQQACESILDHGERLARLELEKIPEDVYRAEDVIDGDGVRDVDIPIRVTLSVEGGELTADFTGTAPQAAGPVNCSYGALESACKTVFRAITAPQAPSNDGCFRPFHVVCPPGTVFSAQPPAPTGWYYEASAFATELVWKALGSVMPEKLGAGSYLSLCTAYTTGTDSETSDLLRNIEGPELLSWSNEELCCGFGVRLAPAR